MTVETTAQTGLVGDARYCEHSPRDGHPECPARFEAVMEGIAAAVDPARVMRIDPRVATTEEIALAHDPAYVRLVREEIGAGFTTLSTGDTDVGPRSYDIALLAVGGVLNAVDAVMEGVVRNAFCAVRPPGHHATADRAMGFCIFNNVAIAARYARRQYGLRNVLIADWDVHHGNGTQDIFYSDPNVYYFSTHEWPLFPGTGSPVETGEGLGRGYTLNCPLPAGSTGDDLMDACESILLPAMLHFRPELVILSAGFDARKDEPISGMLLEDEDFGRLTDFFMELADTHSGGRLVSVLEGGYGLPGLAASSGVHVARLTGGSP